MLAVTPVTLYSSPRVQIDADGTRHFGRASLLKFRGVWILNLFGTSEQMAYQHGVLISDIVNQTALPFFAQKINNSINQTYIIKDHPWLRPLISSFVNTMAACPFRSHLPDEYKRIAKALAKGSGVSEATVLSAMTVPDVGQWLTAWVFGKNRISKSIFNLGNLGCSTIVSSPKDRAAEFFHARNLDYEGYGIFDAYPVVIYFHPKANAMPYTSVSSLGSIRQELRLLMPQESH